MRRTLGIGLVALAATVGCQSGNDKPVIPTEIKQPPGMDSEVGRKRAAPKGVKTPDTAAQTSSEK
jgi:hypothetical protein